MPLTLTEYTKLVQTLNTMMTGPQQETVFHQPQPGAPDSTPLIVDALDRFSVSLDGLTTWLREASAFAKHDQQTGEQTPPKPRGRKPATAQGNGQVATPDPLAAPSQTQERPASAPAAAPSPDEGMPDFLNRGKPGGVSPVPASVSPVPPAQAPAATGGTYTEDQVKAVLRAYMNKHGADGPNKLTALLQQYGTSQFSTLPKERWAEVVARANQEMLL